MGCRRRRRRDLRGWGPDWPPVRSQAAAAALAGDPEPLHRFAADGLAADRAMQANLRYWAYWVGGVRPCWSADADMLALHPYTGEVLVDSLIASLADAPYRELCAHSMWALLRLRPRLAGDPARGGRLSGIIGAVAGTAGTLSSAALRRLDQIAYRTGR